MPSLPTSDYLTEIIILPNGDSFVDVSTLVSPGVHRSDKMRHQEIAGNDLLAYALGVDFSAHGATSLTFNCTSKILIPKYIQIINISSGKGLSRPDIRIQTVGGVDGEIMPLQTFQSHNKSSPAIINLSGFIESVDTDGGADIEIEIVSGATGSSSSDVFIYGTHKNN